MTTPIIKEGQDQITALLNSKPHSISDARAIVETTALAYGEAKQKQVEIHLAKLVSALHKEFVHTGLATEQQWNEGVAPHLKKLGNVVRGLVPDSPTARVYKYPADYKE